MKKKLKEENHLDKKRIILENGAKVFFLGSTYLIEIIKGKENKVKISKKKLQVIFINNKKIKNILEEWYKKKISDLIEKKLIIFSKKIGVNYQSFKIKKYKTRLGSCSSKADLSFNWKLVMMPEAVIDYVIIHELCHIIHFNHSKIFWNKVAEYCPEFNLQKKWIKKNLGSLTW